MKNKTKLFDGQENCAIFCCLMARGLDMMKILCVTQSFAERITSKLN